jgi:transcriptional regulator with XRE-family HTH domain
LVIIKPCSLQCASFLNRLSDPPMKNRDKKTFSIDQFIGVKVKQARKKSGYKIAEISLQSGISQGMISKIENAQVATSLVTLQRLCDAIGLPISKLFSEFDKPESNAHFTKAGQGQKVVGRGTQKGHQYYSLRHQSGGRQNLEPLMVTMDDVSEIFPTFSHPGEEFIYLEQGKLIYQHGNSMFEMEPGDSLVFDGNIPHGPVKLLEVPIKLLSVIDNEE